MAIYIGLDIGGTKLMVAAADAEGSILHKVRAATPDDLEQGLHSLDHMISEVADGERILGMGAAIGGPLDWQKGIVSPLHQPAWRNVPLKKIMESHWNCPFFVDVDTNVAAFGEYYASGIAVRRFLYITLSTGMGGGFLVDGKIFRGMAGTHPEVGHQAVAYHCMNPAAIRCECGVPDCLEALVSGNGIRRIYGKPAESLLPAEWEEVAYNLGQGLRNAATFYAPDLIRLGGGVAVGGGEAFIQQAAAVMRQHLQIVPAPIVELSHLGYETALLGAVAVAIHGMYEQTQ
jgi:glucokinase